jgi:hypothetical protein
MAVLQIWLEKYFATPICRGNGLRKLEENVVMVSQVIETGLGPFPQLHSDSLG